MTKNLSLSFPSFRIHPSFLGLFLLWILIGCVSTPTKNLTGLGELRTLPEGDLYLLVENDFLVGMIRYAKEKDIFKEKHLLSLGMMTDYISTSISFPDSISFSGFKLPSLNDEGEEESPSNFGFALVGFSLTTNLYGQYPNDLLINASKKSSFFTPTDERSLFRLGKGDVEGSFKKSPFYLRFSDSAILLRNSREGRSPQIPLAEIFPQYSDINNGPATLIRLRDLNFIKDKIPFELPVTDINLFFTNKEKGKYEVTVDMKITDPSKVDFFTRLLSSPRLSLYLSAIGEGISLFPSTDTEIVRDGTRISWKKSLPKKSVYGIFLDPIGTLSKKEKK